MSDTDQMRRRLADATAGDYEILGELGRGGMAAVYLAHDLSLDRRVAIKVMAPQLAAVDGMAERFLLEARVAAALSHPHIVPIHAVRRTGDLLYFVMKYIAGRSLDVVLVESGPLSVPVVRVVLTQVGAALEAAHGRGIVHRDIKPANILIDERGDVVVADFGIARVESRRGMTQVGETVGTPEYMSPEQCSGEALTGAADQYSLGVVAYELLTGAPPFTGEGLMQVVWRMVNEDIVRLEHRRPECAGAIASTVHRMLAHRAHERWPTVADAVAALPPLILGATDPIRDELVALSKPRADAAARAVKSADDRQRASAATVTTLSTSPLAPIATAIRLTFSSGLMTIDDEVTLLAEVSDAAGVILEDADVRWSSSDPDVARVAGNGAVTGVRFGTTVILAVCGDASATLDLTVTRSGLRDFGIAPRAASLEVGDRLCLGVTAGGDAQSVRARLVDWNSSDPRLARIDASGVVTAFAEGKLEITARAGGGVATLPLRVTRAVIAAVSITPPTQRISIGERLLLRAEPSNPRGFPLVGYPVLWQVSDPGIAVISPDGVLTALKAGQVLVAARVEGRVGTTKVMVSPRD